MEKIRWQKMLEDTKKFFTAPVELYQNFEKEGGYSEPIVYTTIIILISELIVILLFTILHLKHLKILLFSTNMAISFLLIPLFLIFFFISTVILHLIWIALGSRESFETSLRCTASFSPLIPAGILISIIPFFGKWIGTFAYLFALCFYIITASVYVHKIDEVKARKVFLIIFIVITFLKIANLIRAEINERKTKEMIRKMEEDYQKKMEEYERQMMEQQQRMYEEYQRQMQQNQIPQNYPESSQ
ncbi:MAG: YIP1 family protein [bacterium]|nr:YIP1 family protein [bacterium]